MGNEKEADLDDDPDLEEEVEEARLWPSELADGVPGRLDNASACKSSRWDRLCGAYLPCWLRGVIGLWGACPARRSNPGTSKH